MIISRRDFVRTLGIGSTASVLMPLSYCACAGKNSSMPEYLKDYSELYKTNQKEAALKWFKEADFGLFLHYGLYMATRITMHLNFNQ
jgi:alpha-L-fucosidase